MGENTTKRTKVEKKNITLPGSTVKKSNQFIRSKLKLDDVTAARLFTGIIACIHPDDTDFQNYKLPAGTIIATDSKGGVQYKRIRAAIDFLLSCNIEMALDDDPSGPGFAKYPIFSRIAYQKGTISAQVHPDLKPHFIKLAQQFTVYSLMEYLMLSSTYSQRIFEILQSYAKSYPQVLLPLKNLHFMLDTPESLKTDFAQFRRRVLEQAHKEISAKTNFYFKWEAVKKGRSIHAVRFIFTHENDGELEKKQKTKKEQHTGISRNKSILLALDCSKKKHGQCLVQDNKTWICKMCIQMDFCKEIANRSDIHK